MEGFWPIFFLLVVLKIPVFGALWLVWWASKAPEADGFAEDSDDGFKRWRPEPHLPRDPRRDPHGGAATPRRRRGAPPAQRRPVFRPTPIPRTAAASPGERPSKQEGRAAASPYTR